MTMIPIYRAPGPSGVLVEDVAAWADRATIWRWPGWAMNDYEGKPPSLLRKPGEEPTDWYEVDRYYWERASGRKWKERA